MAHDLARQAGGRFLLRIEDIDSTRCRPDHIDGIMEDLRWLGLNWDGEVWRQSARMAVYADALDRLKAMDLLYPCFCTRAEITAEIAASGAAPHGPEGQLYPGTCRRLTPAQRQERLADTPCAWRLDMAGAVKRAGLLQWHDSVAGMVTADPMAFGDVVLARKEVAASYHLCVVIDDAAQGVTGVVRGQDLFTATHVHRLLQALLGLPTPRYHHHPLLVDAGGRRLAKRDRAATLASMREAGVDPAMLVARLRRGELPVGIAGEKA